jgi:hypothetical protein
MILSKSCFNSCVNYVLYNKFSFLQNVIQFGSFSEIDGKKNRFVLSSIITPFSLISLDS